MKIVENSLQLINVMINLYNILDISVYIINYCNKSCYYISNLRLQQILYFTQIAFLVIHNKECFQEEIEAWDFGPVVPSVYNRFCKYANLNIPIIEEYIDTSKGIWNAYYKSFTWDTISQHDTRLINDVIEACEKYSISELLNIITNQQPWLNANKRIYDKTINKQELLNYFKQYN